MLSGRRVKISEDGREMGGVVPLGYDLADRHLVLNPAEADQVKQIYKIYLRLGCVTKLKLHLEKEGVRSKKRVSQTGQASGGAVHSRGSLYRMLHNRIYLGAIVHKAEFDWNCAWTRSHGFWSMMAGCWPGKDMALLKLGRPAIRSCADWIVSTTTRRESELPKLGLEN